MVRRHLSTMFNAKRSKKQTAVPQMIHQPALHIAHENNFQSFPLTFPKPASHFTMGLRAQLPTNTLHWSQRALKRRHPPPPPHTHLRHLLRQRVGQDVDRVRPGLGGGRGCQQHLQQRDHVLRQVRQHALRQPRDVRPPDTKWWRPWAGQVE